MALPEDVVNYILEYGDPIVTEKYKCVLNQINYLFKEFNYKRCQMWNVWKGYKKSQFMIYILYKNKSKNRLNID
jgi:hypothetical protein